MGCIPVPPPITDLEFRKRWDAGARTLEELDPRLFRWIRTQERVRRFQLATIIIGCVWVLWFVVQIIL